MERVVVIKAIDKISVSKTRISLVAGGSIYFAGAWREYSLSLRAWSATLMGTKRILCSWSTPIHTPSRLLKQIYICKSTAGRWTPCVSARRPTRSLEFRTIASLLDHGSYDWPSSIMIRHRTDRPICMLLGAPESSLVAPEFCVRLHIQRQ